ncbi:MAG: carbamoyl phosphate synthase small subunit [Oscillospiraceae bacterium]|nr:carbamoyl phosphate synthase small subunit [Oscillospiraceae bacterium]
MSKPAYLILENGRIFEGKYWGAIRDTFGEIVFSTAMTGYLETLTDNSYFGQIVLQTFPLIGNYGIIPPDFESLSPEAKPNGYIVKSWCEEPSNFRSEGNLDTFLENRGIPGIYGIDTREVAKIIRENGVMNAKITGDRDNIDFDEIKNYRTVDQIRKVSRGEIKEFKGAESRYRVVLLDFGLKESIKQRLLALGCDVWAAPYDTDAEKIKNMEPDGIVLSDGPGDPEENPGVINNLKEILDLNIPAFGICLGHQLLALANGFRTEKLKFGHRGANQPVKSLSGSTRPGVYITNQNHGYAVVNESIDKNIAELSFENVNDKTCEGIDYIDRPVTSVQFHPDDCLSPHGTGFIYHKFIGMMSGNRKNSKQGGNN